MARRANRRANEPRVSSAQQVEAAMTYLPVSADRQGVGRRNVPAQRKIRDRALGRNPERDLDLAHIGRKAGAATHC